MSDTSKLVEWTCQVCGLVANVPESTSLPIRHSCIGPDEEYRSPPQDGLLSVIITAFNEGGEVQATVDSIRANTSNCEIVIVDDGSTDASCADLHGVDRLIRHDVRIGIAASRNAGAANAQGSLLAFLDAHQRVEEGCLNKCAGIAQHRRAIVWPCVRGLEDRGWTGHGAFMRMQDHHKKRGLFGGKWNNRVQRDKLSRCSTMIVPGYVMSRSTYEIVRWIDGLSGWGASEPAITVKAFFADVDILHLCGPLARHYFREGLRIPYETPWRDVAMNHAKVARVCFEAHTWSRYWQRKVFKRWLKEDDFEQLNSEQILSQQAQFRSIKRRSDNEFWRGLLMQEVPRGVAQ